VSFVYAQVSKQVSQYKDRQNRTQPKVSTSLLSSLATTSSTMHCFVYESSIVGS
jgi:hypothetical protein